MTEPDPTLDIIPSGFFVLRTPLLPFEELEAWGRGLEAPAAGDDPERLASALAADRGLLRQRLRVLVGRPEIRDALFVASPTLLHGLEAWHDDPDSKKGRRAEEALVRYLLRMTTRSTPFGLFSGCSLGTVGSTSHLGLGPRTAYRRHTRLDMGYLFALSEELGRDPQVRRDLRYRPSSSLYRAAGRWRYAEAGRRGGLLSHHLVAVDTTDYLDSTLERARDGATVEELARALVADDPEVTLEEAEEFVNELIDGQLLVSDLAPPITGPGPIHQLIDLLAEVPAASTVRAELDTTRDALAALDAAGLGADPERYRALAKRLEALPAEVDLPRLFQVDMTKPSADATLGPEVLDEIARGAEVLWRLCGPRGDEQLGRFCQDFVARYEEGRTVPLVEALDEEVGIGFQRSNAIGAEASPLLEGLGLTPPPGLPTVAWGGLQQLLQGKLETALREGAHEIEITPKDLASFATDDFAPMPDAFQVMVTLASASSEHLAQGDFEVFVRGAQGPSGMQFLGRFCHTDEGLRRHVEDHLRGEEALDPEAVFAEIVHIGEGRVGNILARPAMRDFEIPILARGDAPRQIPVTDLLVTVWGQRIVLHSASLGRRVIPRLTTAHNYTRRSLGVYRFLCSLQSQGVCGGLSWQWGTFDGHAFLPRLRSGRLVISRARWLIRGEELRTLAKGDDTTRFRAFETLRRARGLPTRLVVADGDNELLVDTTNVLSVEALLALAKKRSSLNLTELYPDPDQLCASGPEGRFNHELVVPFRRREPRQAPPRRLPAPVHSSVRRIFPPGSEWLYAKLYTGTSTADQVLRQLVGPLTRQVEASGAVDRWFFIRYGDPHWHLRLRFHGEPEALHREVLAPLQAAAAQLVEAGYLWRFQIDTYEREIERYGGAEGIELAERLAHADSQAVLEIVESLEGDDGATARWRLALRGVDHLLDDLGLEDEVKLALVKSLQESYAHEFRVGAATKKRMADRLRGERREIEGLFDTVWDAEHPLAPGFEALARRSRQLAPIVAELRARAAAGRLTAPLPDLGFSYVHMFVNRLMRSEARAQEVVLHDFLSQITQSRIARARARAAQD